jgi:hypothetical protein
MFSCSPAGAPPVSTGSSPLGQRSTAGDATEGGFLLGRFLLEERGPRGFLRLLGRLLVEQHLAEVVELLVGEVVTGAA